MPSSVFVRQSCFFRITFVSALIVLVFVVLHNGADFRMPFAHSSGLLKLFADRSNSNGRMIVRYGPFDGDSRVDQQPPKIKPSTHGVFVIVDLLVPEGGAMDDAADGKWISHWKLEVERLSNRDHMFANCDLQTINSYRLYILLHAGDKSNPRLLERRRLVVGWIAEVIQRITSRGCLVILKEVEVKDSKKVAQTLNDAMMDAYLEDGVDYFLLPFNNRRSVLSITRKSTRNLSYLTTVLRSFTNPVDHGVVVVADTISTVGQLQSQPAAIFFSRTHFDIFGLFFPRSLTDIRSAVSHIVRLYATVNLTITIIDDLPKPKSSTVHVTTVQHGVASNGSPNGSRTVAEPAFVSDLETLHRYLSAVSNTTCLRCPQSHHSFASAASAAPKQQNIISMSLYGSSRRYTMGAVRNAQIAPITYPGWRLRFYIEPPAGPDVRYGRVPAGILQRVVELGAELIHVNLTAAGRGSGRTLAPMMWRFTVVEDESVDLFIVRDCDSRLTPRDAAVVADWLRQPPATSVFHCVRDHPSHSPNSVSGGLWGGRRRALAELFNGSFSTAMIKYNATYMDDMKFLDRHVWSRVQTVAYCHDSFSCTSYPNSHPFPVKRIGTEHLGQVFDQFSFGRHSDIAYLVSRGVNPACVPPATRRPPPHLNRTTID